MGKSKSSCVNGSIRSAEIITKEAAVARRALFLIRKIQPQRAPWASRSIVELRHIISIDNQTVC